jgi:hypothetical protein
MNNLLRSIRTELRYETWSLTLLWPLAVTFVAVGLGLIGSLSNASATLAQLHSTQTQAVSNGLSLEEAMKHPVGQSVQGSQTLIDNPLRFDYEQAYNAHRALDGWNSIGTGLEMITFIVIPLLFFLYGCAVAVGDVRQRILKERVVVQGARPYVLAKMAVVSGVAVASAVLGAVVSLAGAPILQAFFQPGQTVDFPFTVEENSIGNPVAQILFTAATAMFFGLLGLFIGLVTRTALLPGLLAGALLMVVPFAGPYDPRNILTTAGQSVFNFWGGFSPRTLFPVPLDAGLALMVLGLGIIVAGCSYVWSRMTKFV